MRTRFFFIAEEFCRTSAVHVEKRPETVSICDSKSGEGENKEWSIRCFVGNDRDPGATVEEGLSARQRTSWGDLLKTDEQL